MIKCVFNECWRGLCGGVVVKNDMCSKHLDKVCYRCGAQATQNCSQTMGAFVCGIDECAEHPHDDTHVLPVVKLVAAASRDNRQRQVSQWCCDTFGVTNATNLIERGSRLLEESIEAAQATGVDEALAHKLVTYVFNRPIGQLNQELGGVSTTLLALAEAAGLSADDEERREVQRILNKPMDHFRKRHEAKETAGVAMVGTSLAD